MQQSNRSKEGLLLVRFPEKIRMLFMAPYAPNGPGYELNAYSGDGTYPLYYFEIFNRLKRLGFKVESSSKPYTVVHAGGAIDYIFSLFNRMAIRNSEIFVSAYCEYLNISYLGAGPNIRALAEDKFISKLAAQSLGIPIPKGAVYHNGITPLECPPFEGPYFIKNRYGAASEGITVDNVQENWSGVMKIIKSLWERGTDALVEEFIDGIDITVPIVGDTVPRMLGVFHPPSDKPGNILTEDLKLTDPLGYHWYEPGDNGVHLMDDALKLWNSLGQIDYFRMDYRLNPNTGERKFIEFNICCYISEHGPFGLAAEKIGVSADALMNHIIAFSLWRQAGRRNYGKRIL